MSGDRRGITTWDRWLNVSIEELDLPDSIIRRLARAGIITVGQLASTTEEDLKRIYWFGKWSVDQINQALLKVELRKVAKYIPHSHHQRFS